MDKRHALGRRGEDLAAAHLQALGYQVVARNHANRFGELDLVALDGATVVLAEVKTRGRAGTAPAEAVDFRKRRKLSRAAALFLKLNGWEDRPARFDVVEVVAAPDAAPVVNHIRAAFEAEGEG